MDLYIYYKVRTEHGARLAERALGMQQTLLRDYGIVTGLKRRPQENDGRQTWMEIYQNVPDGFEASLANAVAGSGLLELIDGQRHTEHFMDVSSCA